LRADARSPDMHGLRADGARNARGNHADHVVRLAHPARPAAEWRRGDGVALRCVLGAVQGGPAAERDAVVSAAEQRKGGAEAMSAARTSTAASKTAVLGAGAWGTALAKVLADKGEYVEMWARRADLAAHINEAR